MQGRRICAASPPPKKKNETSHLATVWRWKISGPAGSRTAGIAGTVPRLIAITVWQISRLQSSTTKLRTSKPSVLRDFFLWSLAKNFRHLPEMYKYRDRDHKESTSDTNTEAKTLKWVSRLFETKTQVARTFKSAYWCDVMCYHDDPTKIHSTVNRKKEEINTEK